MRISVSESLCSGHGRCYAVGPEVYTSDDEGYCAQRGATHDVPAGLETAARAGADACPEGAITITSEETVSHGH
jgi:ferredoxin